MGGEGKDFSLGLEGRGGLRMEGGFWRIERKREIRRGRGWMFDEKLLCRRGKKLKVDLFLFPFFFLFPLFWFYARWV